jgi:quinol monooxygenase YgiN
MKNLIAGVLGLLVLAVLTGSSHTETISPNDCRYDKDSMRVVMRFEIKVMPEYVDFLKKSFDACKAEVLAREPGCLDYSLFQSYHDSTLFCITETWATKGDHNAHMQLEHTRKHIAETRDIRDPGFQSTTNYMYWICPGANEVP